MNQVRHCLLTSPTSGIVTIRWPSLWTTSISAAVSMSAMFSSCPSRPEARASVSFYGTALTISVLVGSQEMTDPCRYLVHDPLMPCEGSREPCTVREVCAHRSEEHKSELQSPCNLVCR